MPVELLPEIWLKVLKLLRRHLPRPTGKNERSSIRQRDLATCMRISRLWNNLAGPLLYTNIVTDSLPLLVHRSLPSAAKGVLSKAELLAYMERLYLEYSPKATPSYETLLRYGGSHFALIEMSPVELARLCTAECDEIAASAKKLVGLPNRMLSISTGAFLGGQKEIWLPVCEDDPSGFGFPERAVPARIAISLLISNPHFVYFCNRVEYGPLTYINYFAGNEHLTPLTPAGPSSYQHHAHVELDTSQHPVVLGGSSRWYCPFDRPENYTNLTQASEKLVETIVGQLRDREDGWHDLKKDKKDRLLATNPFLHVDIYLPPPMMHPKAKDYLVLTMEKIRKGITKQLGTPPSRCAKDVFDLHSIIDAPLCEACGWCPDDLEEKGPPPDCTGRCCAGAEVSGVSFDLD